jgi:hypothetical protein
MHSPIIEQPLTGEFEGRQISFRLNGQPVIVKSWHRVFKFYTVYLSAIRISVVSKKKQPAVAADMLLDLYNNHVVDEKYEFDDMVEIESFRLYDMRYVSMLVFGGFADQEVYLLKIQEEFFSLVINGLTINVGPAAVCSILYIIGLASGSIALQTVIYVWVSINAVLAFYVEKRLFIESRLMKQTFAGFKPRSSMVEYFVTQPKISESFKGK